jgi:hypothetical protein
MATQTVDEFMDALDHPHHAAVQGLRAAILAADPAISETVKWNAPNFRAHGEDRVTFRLFPGGRLELILHRGVRVRSDAPDVQLADPEHLVSWVTSDRGVISLKDAADAEAKRPVIVDLVRRWIAI